MKGKLTKRSIDALKPAERTTFLWDTEVNGFGIRVTPKGVKAYVVQWTDGRRSRRVTIGRHGSPWTPEAARREALRIRAAVLDGHDPGEERAARREAPAVRDLVDRFLDEHGPKLKARSREEYERALRKHVVPALGAKKIADVRRTDFARLHHALRGRPYQANRLLAIASKMFALAERWGWLPEGAPNPARGIDKYPERSRERFLSPAELRRLGEVLDGAEAKLGVSPLAVAALRLLLLTGCRRNEVLRLRWDEVDLDGGFLRLKDSKTGRKTIPLSAPAASVLAGLPRVEGSPFVLPGRIAGKPFVGLRNQWLAIRDSAGLDDVRLHDLRHAFASVAAAGGEALPIIGSLLGHSQWQTTQRYSHLSDDPRRAAAERVAGTIAAALDGRDGGEVVPMGRQR